jgi:hypothetical protein
VLGGAGASMHTQTEAPPTVDGAWLRVRVEIMGSQKCRIVGKSQSVLIMTNPIIFTRTRRSSRPARS